MPPKRRFTIRRVLAAHLRTQANAADKNAWQLEQFIVRLPILADTADELQTIVIRLRLLAKRLRHAADELAPKPLLKKE